MKHKHFLLIIFLSLLSVCCKHNKDKKYDVNDDPAKMAIPSNNDATNPSMADTAYVNKDTVKKHEHSK
jgi:hypothetical protein